MGTVPIEVLYYCNNSFGEHYWVSLVRKDIRNLQLMIESTHHVQAASGIKTRGLLGKFLHEILASDPGFKSTLEEMSKNDSNEDSR